MEEEEEEEVSIWSPVSGRWEDLGEGAQSADWAQHLS